MLTQWQAELIKLNKMCVGCHYESHKIWEYRNISKQRGARHISSQMIRLVLGIQVFQHIWRMIQRTQKWYPKLVIVDVDEVLLPANPLRIE